MDGLLSGLALIAVALFRHALFDGALSGPSLLADSRGTGLRVGCPGARRGRATGSVRAASDPAGSTQTGWARPA